MNTTKNKSSLLQFTIILTMILVPVFTQDAGEKPNPVEKITESYYRIGTVHLDKDKKEVYINGKVNMIDGMIELVACGPRGKLHESVLVLDIVPHELQVALLLLGMESSRIVYNDDSTQVVGGDEVEIFVSWDDEKTVVTAGELFKNIETGKPPKTKWIFLGSRVLDGLFVADKEESIVTTYHDPYSIIDFAASGADNDELFVVNKDVVPPVGTPVKMTIKVLQ